MPFNHLYVLLESFPDSDWNCDWIDLNRNPNISREIMENNLYKNHDCENLSVFSDLTWNIMKNNIDELSESDVFIF